MTTSAPDLVRTWEGNAMSVLRAIAHGVAIAAVTATTTYVAVYLWIVLRWTVV